MPDFALFASRKERLRRSGWCENLIHVFHRADGVKLVEIHMIGVETLQGAFQFLAGALCVAARGLFRQENLAAIWLQRLAEFDFRFTVEIRRGTVEVIHAPVIRGCDAA